MSLVKTLHRGQHDCAYGVLVEVEGKAIAAVLELEQLIDRRPGQTTDVCNAVAEFDDPADLLGFGLDCEITDVACQRSGDVIGVDRELRHR